MEAKIALVQLQKELLKGPTESKRCPPSLFLFFPTVPHQRFATVHKILYDNRTFQKLGLTVVVHGKVWTIDQCMRYVTSLLHLSNQKLMELPLIQVGIIGRSQFVATTSASLKSVEEPGMKIEFQSMIL